jgi:thymidylate synthase ThyX|nr:MAG TPA: Thymidylate synthase complementing protein [Caudoviricetes sp.]
MIECQVIADSIMGGTRITSVQVKYPRFILPQLNTHRVFSRSTASSRAVPTTKLIEMVRNEPVIPVHWGQNQAGMVAESEMDEARIRSARILWSHAADTAANIAQELADIGVHKQVVNRILEPFMWAETIITATEWENFFTLRLADDAQPEIQALAKAIHQAMAESVPEQRAFHLPYLREDELNNTRWTYTQKAKISAARCARVSYLNHNKQKPSVEEDFKLAERLIEAGHMSPFDHQAKFNSVEAYRNENRNFRNWQPYRTLLEDTGGWDGIH